MDGIPPENFLAMVQAVHRYGRYGRFGRLGQADSTTLAQPLVLSPVRPLAY